MSSDQGQSDSESERRTTINKGSKLILVASISAILAVPVFADSDKDRQALEHQIEALQARVTALEAERTFARFMPDVAERFHVMHRAGEAGDWAVASHELAEIKRLTELSTAVDLEKGKLMKGMMAPSFDALGEAIEHTDHEKFEQALTQTISTCNACHAATGSDFIQVTLDASETVSLRHPHRLMQRDVPSGHRHGMPTGHGTMMSPAAPGKKDHDDTGKSKHMH